MKGSHSGAGAWSRASQKMAANGLAGCGKSRHLTALGIDRCRRMRLNTSEEVTMRGDDQLDGGMFSYISPEQRVPKDHPLRPIRTMVDTVLKELSPRFEAIYSTLGRPSIAPEKLLRALLLQVLYTVRSERMLMEQLDYN